MERDLSGKCALVTGGTRGIGKAVALALAARGSNVAISFQNSAALAQEVVREVEALGVRGAAFQSDQADPAAAKDLIRAVIKAFGRLDILVNNAGIAHRRHLEDGSEWTAADRLWAVNTLGVVATIRAAAPVLADDGRIITIGSVSGTRAGGPGSAEYCGSKAAVAGYTRGAAHDLAPRRITANVIEAGMINTGMALTMPEESRARLLARSPAGRFGDLSEIAALVGFLASPAAAYITGATLTIDGGFSA